MLTAVPFAVDSGHLAGCRPVREALYDVGVVPPDAGVPQQRVVAWECRMKVARFVVMGLFLGAVAAFVSELLRPRHQRQSVQAVAAPAAAATAG